MKRLVLDYLIEQNLLSDEEKDYTPITLKICNNKDVIISGGKIGLIELADYIVDVALSEAKRYHIHLDKDLFFNNSSYELIIEKLT